MPHRPLISVICPVYNEQEAVPLFYERLQNAIVGLRDAYRFELLFTNNCSTDLTRERVLELRRHDPSVQLITLSRNFGYQASLLSGLNNAAGDAIVIIDVDCEDPPEFIPRLIEGWQQGHDLVYGIRKKRPEFIVIQWARLAFYRITRLIADNDFILDMAEFSLFTRRVRDAILANRSSFPFIRAEIGAIGFKRLGIPYEREPRVCGESHYNLLRMFQFAVGGMLSSSTFFLRLGSYVGFPLVAANLALSITSLFVDTSAWSTAVYLVNFSFVSAMLALISIYIARIYKDGLSRPLYLIDHDRSTIAIPIQGVRSELTSSLSPSQARGALAEILERLAASSASPSSADESSPRATAGSSPTAVSR